MGILEYQSSWGSNFLEKYTYVYINGGRNVR
jgi:hypothetical protein